MAATMFPSTINPSELFGPTSGSDGLDGDLSSCQHILDAFVDEELKARVIQAYRGAVGWRVQRMHDNVHTNKRRKLSAPQCGTCHRTLARPFVCLQCSFAGCWQDEHISEHLADEAHYFAVDTNTGAVFCSECDDFFYEPTLDTEYKRTLLAVDKKNARFLLDKKPRDNYRPWISWDDGSLEATMTRTSCQSRCGLLNLGQTCFLNVVLQALIHNPLLRNHFLADKHNYLLCENMECTSCEMDKLFTSVFAQNPSPIGPTGLLAAAWRSSSGISGYAQHDAHECLIALLNSIHASTPDPPETGCPCIVHTTFGGVLQSEVRCGRCANPSRTPEECLDISLSLHSATTPDTLAACLKRFTSPEKLGAKEYSCPKCGKASNEAIKRMSITKLPPVLSFQFKRFEQTGPASVRKIGTPVRIPSRINMAPYTYLAQAASKSEPGSFLTHPGPEGMYEYDLFAIINHEGDLNTGHYTNFARFEDEWYKFDDDKVTPSTLSSALTNPIPIYMAFYVKRELDYGPGPGPDLGIVDDLFDAAFDTDIPVPTLDTSAMDTGGFSWGDPGNYAGSVGANLGGQGLWDGNVNAYNWETDAQREARARQAAQEVEDELMELV
ncbi:cysteine proteinase [Peniophora sp. CONT]|nr:cysteine proteinase [Peniophora sp. CONT]